MKVGRGSRGDHFADVVTVTFGLSVNTSLHSFIFKIPRTFLFNVSQIKPIFTEHSLPHNHKTRTTQLPPVSLHGRISMSDVNVPNRAYAPGTYALSGKIMLSAIVILFAVVLLIICLHMYARWFIARRQRQHQQFLRNRRRRRAHIVFTTDLSTSAGATISHGLEPSLLKSLPTFVYSSTTHDKVLECAVCLSEFEENEKGRLLPKCNHSFHIGCIDMWFHSHSTCPLCRSPITKPEYPPPQPQQALLEIVINSHNPHPDSAHRQEEDETSSSSSSNENTSVGSRRKGFDLTGVSIEVPRRTEELFQGSPAGVFKSPGGRLLSFKMRLGRRNSSTSISCSSATEIDLERGEIEEDHVHVLPSSDHSMTH